VSTSRGRPRATSFPVTPAAYQTSRKITAAYDAFVLKTAGTTSTAYATFPGGDYGVDEGFGTDVDASGAAYITEDRFAVLPDHARRSGHQGGGFPRAGRSGAAQPGDLVNLVRAGGEEPPCVSSVRVCGVEGEVADESERTSVG
jgi:hypothetical protein